MARAAGTTATGGTFLTRGHRVALEAVSRSVMSERPAHALLLLGPRGVGKTTLALDLAAGLLCLADDPATRPCRSCAACRKVTAGAHPDLHRLEPEGAGEQIRVGQVAMLASELALTALEGRFRVAIISSAQRLNLDAQHALLKTLEEPGPRTCLVLCADDAAPLLPTVLSRSARLRLAPLPVEALTDMLVADGHAAPAQARSLAIAAGGRPGLALRLAAEPEAIIARRRIAHTLLDLLPADQRTRLAAALDLVHDGAVVDAALRGELPSGNQRMQPQERRRAVQLVLDVWRDVGRDLAVAARTGGAGIRDLDQLEALRNMGARVDPSALRRSLDRLDRLVVALEGYASPELMLDVLLLTWPRPRAGTPRAA